MLGSQPLTSYHKLAALYDHLMENAPYDEWMAFTLAAWGKLGIKPQVVADLGCGTGTFLRYLFEYGVQAYGVDLSEGMLQVAKEKLARSHPKSHLQLLCQDIRHLNLPEPVDCILSYCDTLNYIIESNGVKDVFHRAYQGLKPGGLFIFDVHTPWKVETFFGNETFTDTDAEVSYIWECQYEPVNREVTHDLTLFAREEGDRYRRYHEIHHQRAYPLEELQQWLQEVGFSRITLSADFTFNPVEEESERAFFVAQR